MKAQDAKTTGWKGDDFEGSDVVERVARVITQDTKRIINVRALIRILRTYCV